MYVLILFFMFMCVYKRSVPVFLFFFFFLFSFLHAYLHGYNFSPYVYAYDMLNVNV